MRTRKATVRKKEARPGWPSKSRKPSKAQLARLYETEARSVRDIAELLGCSKDMVFRSLKEYGLKARKKERRSSLRQYDIAFLEAGVREKGLRGFARALRIDKSALLRHIRIRKAINQLVLLCRLTTLM